MSKTTNKFSPEGRERAVRLVLGNEGQHGARWQAVMSISAKIGCAKGRLPSSSRIRKSRRHSRSAVRPWRICPCLGVELLRDAIGLHHEADHRIGQNLPNPSMRMQFANDRGQGEALFAVPGMPWHVSQT